MPPVHVPILVEPIVSALIEPFVDRARPEPAWLIDCTLGGGGHTRALLEALPAHHRMLSIDQDAGAITRAREAFAPELAAGRLELVHARFSEAAEFLGDRP